MAATLFYSVEWWKEHPKHKGYFISSFGRVRNSRGKILTQHLRNSYPSVWLGSHVQQTVHTLVLEAFVGLRPSSDHQCCHYDGNKENNHLRNLRWGTRKENMRDQFRHGTFVVGSKNGRAKLTEKIVHDLRASYFFIPKKPRSGARTNFCYRMGRLLGVRWNTIYAAVRGKENWRYT